MKFKKLLAIFLLFLVLGRTAAFAQWCPATSTGSGSGCSLNFNVSFSTTGGATNITNNNTNCAATSLGYIFYPTMPHTGVQGTTVNFSFTNNPTWNENYGLWVDWNQDFDFDDPGELVYGVTNVSIGSTVTGSFTIPMTAIPGTTRMRLRTFFSSPLTPCNPASGNPVYDGETEDYPFIVVGAVACSGTPTPGTAVAFPTTPCTGSTSSLSLSGSSLNSGVTYQWEEETAPTVWTAIAGATSPAYTTTAITVARRFRCRLTCTNGTPAPAPSYSTVVTVAPYATSLPYLETFDSIRTANTLPNCMSATNLGTQTQTYINNQTSYNRINHTPLPGGDKFASFRYAAATDVLATPGFSLQAGSTYLFTFWYITDGLTGWTGLSAYWGTSPTVAGLTNLIGSTPSPQTNTTYQQFTGTFTPTVSGVYYVGIVCTRTSAPWYLTIDDIGLSELVPCSGTPLAGVIDTVRPCPNQPFTLTTTGGSSPVNFGGLTFEWQDSTVNGWVSSAGINTNPTYTTSVSVPTRFRRVITCANGSQTAITPSYLVVPAPFISCYCVPTYATGATSSIITNVKLNGLNNTSTGSSPWYTDYSRQQPSPIIIPTITMGAVDSVIVTQGSNTTNYSGVWIDFNHSGHFEPSEYFTLGTSVGANGVARIPVNTPLTARPGLTRMRIRAGDRSPVTAVMPCNATASVYGEAEDYLVNIQYPVCSGPTNAGRAEATDTSICIGYRIDVYDTTHEYRRSRITWSWENSTDGGFSWNPVAGSQNKDTLLNILVTRAVQYRLKMVCDETGDSTYSTVANIRINAPYACYCISQSNGGPDDVSDISSVVIGDMVNTTSGPHLENPTAVRRRTDYTDIRNIVLSVNGRYRLSVYHTQRNAVHEDALVTVFIDYNNNLEYDAFATPNSERVFQGISTAPNYYIDTAIRIPNAVVPNVPTGLRVILNRDLNPNSPANLGCGPYVSGETEDYVVMFTRSPQHVSGLVNLEHVTLYPNPTTGRFMLSVGAQQSIGKLNVTVSTLTGSNVLHQEYQRVGAKFGQELDLSNVARGVYFVTVRTEAGEKMIQKLIIK